MNLDFATLRSQVQGNRDSRVGTSRAHVKLRGMPRASLVVLAVGAWLVSTTATAATEHERIAGEIIAAKDDLADALVLMKDVATCRQFAPRFKVALQRLKLAAKQAQALPKPSQAEDARLRSLFGKKAEAANRRLSQEIARIRSTSNLEETLRQELGEPFDLGTLLPSAPNASPAPGRSPLDRPATKPEAPRGRPDQLNRNSSGELTTDDRTIRIKITNVDDPEVRDAIFSKLKSMIKSPIGSAFQWTASGSQTTVSMAPVDIDPKEFASQLDFAKVIRIDGRTIEVASTWTRTTLPKPLSQPLEQAEPETEWKVPVDPSTQALEIPRDKDIKIAIPPSFFGGEVVFCSTPSPFVAVGRNGGANELREVWDLRTKKRTGAIRGDIKVSRPFALSADGQFFAAKWTFGNMVGVWSFKTGQGVRPIEVKSPFTDFLEFAGPDEIVTAKVSDKVFQVCNFQTGQLVRQIQVPKAPDVDSLAVSPGRKYLAMASSEDGTLRIYDITSGALAGETTIPREGAFSPKCLGLTFSDDGTELAGVFEPFPKLAVLAWDVRSGTLVANHTFDKDAGIKKVFNFQGRALEWLPERAGWLLFGLAIVDLKTGQRVWTLPIATKGYPPAPRKMIDNDRVLIVTGEGQSLTLQTEFLPKDKIASIVRAVRSGGTASDALLPPLRPTDWSTARRVSVATSPVRWSVVPDSALPAKSIVARPIPLECKISEVQKILFSSPGTAQAVVLTGTPKDPFGVQPGGEGQSLGLDRYDLSSGQHLGRLEAPAVCELSAVSPDGTRVLLTGAKDHDRLDVFSTTDLNHLAGWRPYDRQTGEDRSVSWCEFLDTDRVLTVNRAGTLVLWKLPECRALYVEDGACQGAPSLSPGRKYLAAFAGAAIRLLDPASGESRGELDAATADLDGRPEPKALAFRPDGQQLASLFNSGHVTCWDLKTGRVNTSFRSSASGAALEWCGPRHLLIDNRSLIDLQHRLVVWHYAGGTHATGSPDGRHWFTSGSLSKDLAYLSATTLPEKSLERILKMANDPKVPALVRPGSKITLQLDFVGHPKDGESYRRSIADQLTTRLSSSGIAVADGQPVRLVVAVREVDTGQSLELRKMFPSLGENPFATRVIPIRNLEIESYLADPQGKVELEPKRTLEMRGALRILHIPANEDVERYLRGQLWDSAKAWINRIAVPVFLARQDGTIVRLPGVTNLSLTAR